MALVEGVESETLAQHLTIEDAMDQVPKTEAFLEKLTGLRVHISQVA